MNASLCNVALPVPLRTTFTYAIPEQLRESAQPGSRVLVPFRKKSLAGVIVDFADTAPQGAKLREIAKVLDLVPALTPKLIELAQWIAGYYLAPIGEVFRAMLPPLTELKTQRQVVLTPAGRDATESLSGGELSYGLTSQEANFLEKLKAPKSVLSLALATKIAGNAETLQRLQRLGLIEIHENIRGTKRKMLRVIAWKVSPNPEI